MRIRSAPGQRHRHPPPSDCDCKGPRLSLPSISSTFPPVVFTPPTAAVSGGDISPVSSRLYRSTAIVCFIHIFQDHYPPLVARRVAAVQVERSARFRFVDPAIRILRFHRIAFVCAYHIALLHSLSPRSAADPPVPALAISVGDTEPSVRSAFGAMLARHISIFMRFHLKQYRLFCRCIQRRTPPPA